LGARDGRKEVEAQNRGGVYGEGLLGKFWYVIHLVEEGEVEG